MKVFKAGTKVKLKHSKWEGTIISVCITGNNIEYNIRYIHESSLRLFV